MTDKLDFITAILRDIEYHLDIYINNNELDMDDPFMNTGEVDGFKNEVFEVHAYDWGWDMGDGDERQPFNFKYKDVEIRWYKYLGRGMEINKDLSLEEIFSMFLDCVNSLQEAE